MELILRDAASQDADLLTQIIRAAFAGYDGKLDPPSGAHSETSDQIREKLTLGGGTLALIGPEYAGCIVYYPQDNYLYLGRLSVLPPFRRFGVGKALVESVERKAVEMNIPCVQLGVRLALPGNRAFFERLGYRIISEHSHAGYTEPTFATLEKRITAQ